jgi:hypothetical protein
MLILFDPKLATPMEPIGITASISSQTNVLCFEIMVLQRYLLLRNRSLILFMGYYTITNNGNSNGLIGTYNVTVTDANSCSKILTVLITQPSVDLTSTISNLTNGVVLSTMQQFQLLRRFTFTFILEYKPNSNLSNGYRISSSYLYCNGYRCKWM